MKIPPHKLGGLANRAKSDARHPEKACARCLLRVGYGFKTTARLLGSMSARQVWKVQKDMGGPKNRKRRKRLNGPKPSKQPPASILRWAWNKESMGHLLRDDCSHWALTTRGHPEFQRWYGRQNAKRQYAKHSAKRTNYYISSRLRARIYRVLMRNHKSASTEELLGCTFPEFRAYLERQFKRGMTWENYGNRWHIDHIVPCSAFDLSDPRQQRIAFNFANLRPMWATENRRKHDRVTEPQLPLPLTHTARQVLPSGIT